VRLRDAEETMCNRTTSRCIPSQTCIARAWDFKAGKPFLVAPAMNMHMWDHPFTSKQLDVMQSLGAKVIVPQSSKVLACGDKGSGALAKVSDLVDAVKQAVGVGVQDDKAETTGDSAG